MLFAGNLFSHVLESYLQHFLVFAVKKTKMCSFGRRTIFVLRKKKMVFFRKDKILSSRRRRRRSPSGRKRRFFWKEKFFILWENKISCFRQNKISSGKAVGLPLKEECFLRKTKILSLCGRRASFLPGENKSLSFGGERFIVFNARLREEGDLFLGMQKMYMQLQM